MSHLNIEIKARCQDPAAIREYLVRNKAEYLGVDSQTDTYFNVSQGRLKLREGNIENNLIYYERNDEPGAKESNFQLVKTEDSGTLKNVLSASLGIKAVVEKSREIYYINNVKFHIDQVYQLGSFVEIEASNLRSPLSKEKLQEQCSFYLAEFGVRAEDLVASSYGDMILQLAQVNEINTSPF